MTTVTIELPDELASHLHLHVAITSTTFVNLQELSEQTPEI